MFLLNFEIFSKNWSQVHYCKRTLYVRETSVLYSFFMILQLSDQKTLRINVFPFFIIDIYWPKRNPNNAFVHAILN